MTHSILSSVRAFLEGSGATILPELELLLFALGVSLIDRWLEPGEKRWNAVLALSGAVFSAYTLWTLRAQVAAKETLFGFDDAVLIDPFFLFFAALLLAAVALTILFSIRMLNPRGEISARFYSWLLLAAAAMLLMLSGTDLVVLFLGQSILSLSFYFLHRIPFDSRWLEPRPRKSAILPLFGPVSTASGFALLYRLASSTNIGRIAVVLGQRNDLARALAISRQPGPTGESMRQLLQAKMPQALAHHLLPLEALPMAALTLTLVGIFLTCIAAISCLPLEASRTSSPSAGLLPASLSSPLHVPFAAIASSTAGFAMFLRLLLTVFSSSQDTWVYLISGLALLGLATAVLLAFQKTTLPAFLLAACLTQFAFLLLGLVSANETGIVGIAFQLFVFVFTMTGAFAITTLTPPSPAAGGLQTTSLYPRNPAAAFLLMLFLFSIAGLPPTSGFLAKYYIFKSLVETRHFVLAIAAALFLLPILFFSVRIALAVFGRPAPESSAAESPATGLPATPEPFTLSSPEAIALGVCLFVTLAAGLYPDPFQRLARYAFGQ